MIFNILKIKDESNRYSIEMASEEFESFIKTLISAYEGYDNDIIPSDYAQVILEEVKKQLPETFNLLSNNLDLDELLR